MNYILPPLTILICYLSYRVGMDSHAPFFVPRLRDSLRRKRTDAALSKDNQFPSKLPNQS